MRTRGHAPRGGRATRPARATRPDTARTPSRGSPGPGGARRGGLVDAAGLSYPSGHAAYSIAWIAVAVAVARGVPRLAERAVLLAAAIAVAVAVGLTRIELRAHYLTDVLGGWGLGAAIFALCGVVGLV